MVTQAFTPELKYRLEIINKINKQLFYPYETSIQLSVNRSNKTISLRTYSHWNSVPDNRLQKVTTLNYDEKHFFYSDIYVHGHKIRIGFYLATNEFVMLLPSDKANKMLIVTPKLRIGTIIKKFRLTAYE